jgi:endonuclease YncB( thermonuclease family)
MRLPMTTTLRPFARRRAKTFGGTLSGAREADEEQTGSSRAGGERFTIEREAQLADGDTFEENSEPYRVVAIEPGHGPFSGVIEASGSAARGQARSRLPEL